MRLLTRLLVIAAALWAAAHVIDGIEYTGSALGLIGLALLFGAVNLLVRPVLSFFSFPLQLLTLGLFTLVLNAAMLLLTAWLAARFDLGFAVHGFLPALLGAVLISIVTAVLNAIFVRTDEDD